MIHALFLVSIQNPYLRMAGEYRGEMRFYDLFQKKEMAFPIDLRVVADSDGKSATVTTKFRYAPPKYKLDVSIHSASENGLGFTEETLNEKLTFVLRGWKAFSEGSADWFEIERSVVDQPGYNRFRRRYTFQSDRYFSEKWLRKLNGEWEFSHKMDLKRFR